MQRLLAWSGSNPRRAIAGRGNMGEISTDEIQRLIRTAGAIVIDPLPHVINQVGSTCGIYALDTALRIRGIKAPPPRKGKTAPPPPPNTKVGPSMRQIAKSAGLTKVGELFDIADVLNLAALSGAVGAIPKAFDNADDLWAIVKEAVGGKGSVMFAFCVDNSVKNDSKPKTDGKNPHWCLLVGGYEAGTRHVIATQYGKFYDWSLDLLVASNKSLQKWDAQDWSKLTIMRLANSRWEEVYRGWTNKTSPPSWLPEWEQAARDQPNGFKVEWGKAAAFSEVNFALTLRCQCVII
jgi:hypothetical protein